MSEIAVRVALRARPLVLKEIKDGAQDCLRFIPNEPQVIVGQDKAFTFDYVFPGEAKQEALYKTAISDRIDYLFKGYNVTILAYGQTGSGKTYTMGTAYSASDDDNEAKFGVIQRAVTDIFDGIRERSSTAEFLIKVSFLEVYNEDVFDLLQKNKDSPSAISIREDQDGIKIVGLTEQPVVSPHETFQALELGTRSRTTASTAMNTRSSRSHAIFTVTLEQRALDNINDVTIAKFHLVDLAGSERAHKTGALGDRFKEGVNINRGLLALGNVISSLCDNNSHIPYRDSKLTRLLQDSLGGNSHTIMIACISPADSNFDETVNTLRYADRARKIKNKPIVNRDPQHTELLQLRRQVQMLQNQLIQGQPLVKTELGENEKQKYNEDIFVLLQRNKCLESENQRLAKELQHSLNQTTALCEKAMLAEITNEQLILKLEEIQAETSKIIEAMMKLSLDNPELQEQLLLLKDCQAKVIEITSDKLKKDAEFTIYSPTKKLQLDGQTLQDFETSPYCNGSSSPLEYDENEDKLHLESTLKQAQMTRDLAELERALALKEELASKMQESDSQMTVMRIQFENNLRQMEEEINNLQKEKEELLNTLKFVQSNNNAGKVSEQRRKRLQELEAKILDMKKQIQEKSRLLKIKQDAERKVNNLQLEIQTMKTNRVKLLRQIKVEAEKYRMLKMEKDREVASLKQQDRKRQYQMTKLQQEFDKQKVVLKRKMEEATAANRRLNNALQQQKQVSERREKEKQQSVIGIGSRVQQWLTQEIEVVLRIKEANHHLQILLDDRNTIEQQLKMLQKNMDSYEPPEKKKFGEKSSSDEDSSMQKTETIQQIKILEQEYELRVIQIKDLQQKLKHLDEDEKNKHRWETVQSMVEAKCAMKWLFDNVVSSKLESIIQASSSNDKIEALENQIQQYKNQYADAVREKDKLNDFIRDLKNHHEQQLGKLNRENEDKTLYLLKQLNHSKNTSDSSTDLNDLLMERVKFQENEIERLSYLSAEIEKKNIEINDLQEQLTLARKGSRPKLLAKLRYSVDSNEPTPTLIKAKEESSSIMGNFLEDLPDSEYSDFDNDENDPDYRATPMWKRTRALRKNVSDPLDYERQKEKKSGGCTCKVSCGSKRCGCNKLSKSCSDLCRCKPETCCNRDSELQSTPESGEANSVVNRTFINDEPIFHQNESKSANETNNTLILTENKDPIFICPVVPPKKHITEDSINNSGIVKQHFRRRSQRYFAPVENLCNIEH